MRTRITVTTPRRRLKVLLSSLGVITGMALAAAAYHWLPSWDPIRLMAWYKVQPRIKQANEESKGETERSTKQITEFFRQRKQNARAFAADVLCFSGKWAYVKDFVYGGSHEKYLEECFERNLFTSDELKAVIESAVKSHVSEVQGRENQLLVAIRADLAGDAIASPSYLPSLGDEARFRREYEAMLERALPILRKDMGVTVTREVVSFIGAEIAANLITELGTSLAVELGVSGGILGAGASSSVFTFGIGIVAGIVVDMALDWVIRQAGYDPEGEIAAKVEQSLNHLEGLILHGDSKTNERYRSAKWYSSWALSSESRAKSREEAQTIEASGGLGLVHQLNRINDIRSRLRDEALKGLILKGGVQ
ncbi:hypothetical protein OJF2_51790 [Aquisphaera giovannonii]|uniref:Uncharacterized protein n=1 Tax=Aquisphaera giovannonii TaxID=406548 RepID=A0A5B9W912_9BACT|nr:hypothetical protein [Aquisphaera giovannonii]QEH36595.1 hypothetical protein OJF2_51790 [Aquisphaera giovannonii]